MYNPQETRGHPSVLGKLKFEQVRKYNVRTSLNEWINGKLADYTSNRTMNKTTIYDGILNNNLKEI